MSALPPRIFLRFFRWYCHPKQLSHIEGDLIEVYQARIKTFGKRGADLRFIRDVLLLFRPAIIKPLEGHQRINTYGMYKSYFKIGLRTLLKNKAYTFINIGGLAVGMAVAILNGLWIWDEFSYNRYFDNYDRIELISELGLDAERGGTWQGTTMTYPLGTELIDKHRQKFNRIVRGSFDNDHILSNEETHLSVRGMYTDEGAPEMFTFKMVRGTRSGLSDSHNVLISKSAAEALFGDEDPINHTLKMNNKTDVVVAGVFEDFPQNTDFYQIRLFAPWSLYLIEQRWIEQRALTDWRNHFLRIYVELPEGASSLAIEFSIKGALKFASEDLEEATREKRELKLYPMSDWHLHPTRVQKGQLQPVVMVKLVGAIGMFVLLLACINFMNLSTARSEKRTKEVGIRKTIGSFRSQLISQFFTESFLIVLFSFVLAIVLSSLSLPMFNDIAGKEVVMPWTQTWFWMGCFAFILLTSVMAGSYPALYLSSFNTIRALKGTFRAGRLASLPRKVLVVFQFSISVVLILGTIIVYQQIQYAKSRPVGYDREGLLMIRKKTRDFNGKYEVLRNELRNTGVVLEVSESMGPMTEITSGNGGWDWKGRKPDFDKSFGTLAVSHLHGRTVGWQFIDGRDFDPAKASDSSGIVITESALKIMELAHPIGEPVTWTWWSDKSRVMHYTILGVIKDMVMDSPYAPPTPTIFYVKGLNGTPSWVNIKIDPRVSISDALPRIESVFAKIIPSVPFEFKFVDEEYNHKFASEERIGNLASLFAVLAVFISCLGLLGLASFVAERRTKEIGIRKVLGATLGNLWSMLSRDFVLLIVISCFVAGPVAYYFLENWLLKFEYRTEISPWIFIVTGLGAVFITLLTVSYQAIKAALMNPANSLKTE